MTLPSTPAPTAIELYAQTNGQIFIRRPIGDGKEWSSFPTGSTNLHTARKAFKTWLSKNKITDIDPTTAPVNSRFGPLHDNDVPISRQLRELSQAAGGRKGNGHANPAIVENAAKARAALALKRSKQDRLAQVEPIVAALAASLQAAAINLKLLQQIIGDEE